ncbi:MAG: hypothetical protein JWP47_1333 [Polaromonas sp.]|jgi:Zn-finger nucleic acid-binding protein|nr:hypothetical protein [Polaromonas sp.]
MKCPSCTDSTLLMTDRQGVEIDYCPQCRGVWLDRGELDKLLERAIPDTPVAAAPQPLQQPAYDRSRGDGYGYDKSRDKNYGGHGYGDQHRKKSWLHDIFD